MTILLLIDICDIICSEVIFVNNEKFKIIECTTEKIIVNREPQNEAEWSMMNQAVNDARIRKMLWNPPSCIQFKD